jgi:hypothetical protein
MGRRRAYDDRRFADHDSPNKNAQRIRPVIVPHYQNTKRLAGRSRLYDWGAAAAAYLGRFHCSVPKSDAAVWNFLRFLLLWDAVTFARSRWAAD